MWHTPSFFIMPIFRFEYELTIFENCFYNKSTLNFKIMSEEGQTIEIPKGDKVGKFTHYFSKIGVGVLELERKLKVGDTIVISGHSQEFEQKVDSMQVEHEQVNEAKPGDAVGMKVDSPVKEGDQAFLKA